MLHPFMTQELVRQRRADLDAQARTRRLGRQPRPRPPARAHPGRGRLTVLTRSLARQFRALVGAGHLPQPPGRRP